MKAQITLKSGAQIVVDIDKLTTSEHPGVALAKLEWVTPDDWTAKLHTVDVDEIAAIVVIREPND